MGGRALKRYVLIFGGGLSNKGAQAMTFIAVSEVRGRFPELEPVVVSDRDYLEINNSQGPYSFEFIRELPLGICGTAGALCAARSAVISSAKRLLRFGQYANSARFYRDAAFALDVSGYAFGDKWGAVGCRAFLDRIELLEKLNIPQYILPQSFGPFRFVRPSEDKEVRNRAARLLNAPRIIFAREQSGLSSLHSLCPNSNVRPSPDIVLQSTDLVLKRIYETVPNPSCHFPSPGLSTVGIVPNRQNYERGNALALDEIYRELISYLLHNGFDVALIRHAREDLACCERIKSLFANNPRVSVYGEDRPCFEYGELFSRLSFLIASRFHSIVHAFRAGVPCIALGWAEKYAELLSIVGYPELMFDVTDSALNIADIEQGVAYLIKYGDEVSRKISAAVSKVQKDNVFDEVEAGVRELLES